MLRLLRDGVLLGLSLSVMGCGLTNLKDPTAIQLGISTLPGGDGQLLGSCLGAEPGAFQNTLYSYVGQKSCKGCHGSGQYPPFASADLNTAFSAMSGIVDLNSPASSRIVAKSKDSHCGADCSTDGTAMTAQIAAWKSLRDTTGCAGANPISIAPMPQVPVGPTRCKAVQLFQKNVRNILANRCFSCHASNVDDFRMPTNDDGALCTAALRKVSPATPGSSRLIREPMGNDHPETGLREAEVNPAWIDWISAEQ